jgi:membrane protease YdiL (CAAX protease family)
MHATTVQLDVYLAPCPCHVLVSLGVFSLTLQEVSRRDMARCCLGDRVQPDARIEELMRRVDIAKRVLKFAVAVAIWELAAAFSLFLPPIVGAAWVAALVGLFLWLFVVRARKDRRLLVRYRQRPIGGSLAWLAAGFVPFLAFQLGLVAVLARIAGYQARHSRLADAYLARPLGWLPLFLLLTALGPLVEEFFCRGASQGLLERRLGASAGITVTAVLFAAGHLDVRGFPVKLVFGLVLGFCVYATRSIWAGVSLHVANNGIAGLAYLRGAQHAAPHVRLPSTQMVWTAGVLMAVTRPLLLLIASKLKEARQSRAALELGNILNLG